MILQGRYILHQALRALGQRERITMVTSFRPRSSEIRDDTVLTTVRPVSDLSELYYQFGKYRLEMLQERIRNRLKSLRTGRYCAKRVNVRKLKIFLRTQIEFLEHMDKEIVEDRCVTQGEVDDSEFWQRLSKEGMTKKRKQASTGDSENNDVQIGRDKRQKQPEK